MGLCTVYPHPEKTQFDLFYDYLISSHFLNDRVLVLQTKIMPQAFLWSSSKKRNQYDCKTTNHFFIFWNDEMIIFSHLVKVYNILFNNCIMWKRLISSCLILQSLLTSSPINTGDCQNDLCDCLPNKEWRILTYKLKSNHLCWKKLLLLRKIILTVIVQVYIYIHYIFLHY